MTWMQATILVIAVALLVLSIVSTYYTLRVRRDQAMYDLIDKAESMAKYLGSKADHEMTMLEGIIAKRKEVPGQREIQWNDTSPPTPPQPPDNLAWIRRQARTPPRPKEE